ncbi:hypothetical protein ACFQE9_05270 [Halopenitus salinus]|uniref:PGF-CTERM sorting domain-containing protein n=2 Tax=Halopenitus salinus TaxID=1198295 RepID=A0ABD5USA8_9EURY
MARAWLRFIVSALLVIGLSGGLGIPASTPTDTARMTSPVVEASAQSPDFEALAPRGRWNSSTGTGEIILDNESYYTVFQGEEDIRTWRDTSGTDVSETVLEGETGRNEGEPLRLSGSIQADQTPGRYSGEDLTVRVQEPRISTVTLYNSVGTELDDTSELQRDESLLVIVDWNYVEAEDLEVDLVSHEGNISIEREVLSANPTDAQSDRLPEDVDEDVLAREVQGLGTTNDRTAYWLFDFTEVDEGTYTLRIEGVDDLTAGEASETIRIDVGTDDTSTTTPTATPTATPTDPATPTSTPSDSPTITPTTSPERTPTTEPPTATTSPTDTATPTEAPTRTTDVEEPGFGPIATVVALVVVSVYAIRSRRD